MDTNFKTISDIILNVVFFHVIFLFLREYIYSFPQQSLRATILLSSVQDSSRIDTSEDFLVWRVI